MAQRDVKPHTIQHYWNQTQLTTHIFVALQIRLYFQVEVPHSFVLWNMILETQNGRLCKINKQSGEITQYKYNPIQGFIKTGKVVNLWAEQTIICLIKNSPHNSFKKIAFLVIILKKGQQITLKNLSMPKFSANIKGFIFTLQKSYQIFDSFYGEKNYKMLSIYNIFHVSRI